MNDDLKLFLKDILLHTLKWIGVLLCLSCAASLFIDSEWLNDQYREVRSRYSGDDSDAATLLYKVEYTIIDAASWMKSLPLLLKICGIGLGYLMLHLGSEDD